MSGFVVWVTANIHLEPKKLIFANFISYKPNIPKKVHNWLSAGEKQEYLLSAVQKHCKKDFNFSFILVFFFFWYFVTGKQETITRKSIKEMHFWKLNLNDKQSIIFFFYRMELKVWKANEDSNNKTDN